MTTKVCQTPTDAERVIGRAEKIEPEKLATADQSIR
jgi:hypothetical protein